MTNLLLVLPDFDVSPYSHIVPSLERALVCTADLVTLDPLHVAKRAHVPPAEVKKLQHALLTSLHADLAPALDITAPPLHPAWSTVSTLDAPLDAALAGGFARGHLTEVVGERYITPLTSPFLAASDLTA
jgi:DNA repair protein RAD57